MKVPAKYNRNNYNSHMDLVKGGFEWSAVGISFFKHLKAGAGVEILFAFHLQSRWKTIVMSTPRQFGGPLKLIMIMEIEDDILQIRRTKHRTKIHFCENTHKYDGKIPTNRIECFFLQLAWRR